MIESIIVFIYDALFSQYEFLWNLLPAAWQMTNVLKINLVIIIYGVHKEGDEGEESWNFRQFCLILSW